MRTLIIVIISALALASAAAQDRPCYTMKTNTLDQFALSVFLPDRVILGRTDNLTVEVKNIGNTNAPGNVEGFSLVRADKSLGVFNLELRDASGELLEASGPIPALNAASGEMKNFILGRRYTTAAGLYPGKSRVKRIYLGEEFKLKAGASYKLSAYVEVYASDKGTALLKVEDVSFTVEE